MTELFTSSTYFCVALTLIAFGFGSLCQKKWKLAILNPILIGAAVVMLVLGILDVPNAVYQQGCQVLSFLLTPATICLAISFYQQFQELKKQLPAVFAGVAAGTVCSIGLVYLLCQLFDFDRALTMALLPKSITTAIGVALSEEIGGISAVTTAAIAITGIIGNMLGPTLCKLLHLKDEVAQGVAFGTASHVIGTSKAVELGHLTGAVSSLSLTLAGMITAIVLSFFCQFL